VLLDLRLHHGAHLDSRRLEELNPHGLGVVRADPDVDAGGEPLCFQEVPGYSRGDDAKVCDRDARRREAGDHRALDHPARGASLARGDDPGPPLERRAERGGKTNRDVGCEVDVHEARHALHPEDARRPARLPDEALEDLRPGLHLLVRIDPYARHDHALGADRDLVADCDALADADVRSEIARAADDRPLDARRAPDGRRRVDDRMRRVRALAQGHAGSEHRVGANGRVGRHAAVVAEERRPFDRVEIVQVDPLADPDVASDADSRDVEAHALVQRVEVRLPELVEVPDVLPVAVHHVAVHRPAHLEEQREELLREVVRAVLGDVPQHLGLDNVDAGVDRVGEHLAPRRLLEEALDAAFLVGDDDPELERVVDRLQADRHGRVLLAVELDQPREVDVAERVAGDDEEGVVEPSGGEPHRARGSERRLLDRVRDVHAERLAAAEVRADRLR